MKTVTARPLAKRILVACLAILGAAMHAGPAPAGKTAECVAPKSVFVDDARSGKDPFFPTSTRRLDSLVRLAPTNSASPLTTYLSCLSLKGLSGTKEQPLALINGYTVAEGELAEIKCGGQILKIRCREIRERSVLVELDGRGEIRELKLREGI